MSCIAWKNINEKDIDSMYTKPLGERLGQIELHIDEVESMADRNREINLVDTILQDIVDVIHEVSNKLPHTKYNKKLKPYWSKHLSLLSKTKKQAWFEWMLKDKPRDDDPDFIRYKAAKKEFHTAVKRAKDAYELSQMEEINATHEMDQTYFWRLVSKKNKKQNSIHPIKLKNGTVLTDPGEIREAWKVYYEDLFTPNAHNNYDNEFKGYVEENLKKYELDANVCLDDILQNDFTFTEIKTVIDSLKIKKAPGWDNITAEQVKYGGDKLWTCLLRLYNCMTRIEHIPSHFKLGLLVPIPKGTKDKANQDNHRGLTLLTVIGKIYEKCFAKRFVSWAKDNKVISDLQGAGKEHCSSLQTAWLLKESICAHVEDGGVAYIGLLDAKKAFDTVWQDGLFFKLYNLGLRGKAWRIMRLMYRGFVCKIKLHGGVSDAFEVLQGLHQGAPFSMDGYCIFDNALIEELQQSVYGMKIIDHEINCAAYADDVTIVARCKNDMQFLVDVAYNYSMKWRFDYNAKKCSVLVIGKIENIENDIKLGDTVLKQSKCETHLGVGLVTSKQQEVEFMQNRISACKSVCYGIQSLGSYVTPLSPIIASRLYNNICIPKLCYGVEIMDVETDTLSCMEQFHSSSSKMFQGLLVQCASVGSVGNIGWLSIEAIIDMMRLLFLWRMLSLPMTCLYKVILVKRITQLLYRENGRGPTWNMIATCVKYGIEEFLYEAVETGIYMSYQTWKSKISYIVNEKYVQRLRVTCKLYKSLLYLEIKGNDIIDSNGWVQFLHSAPHCARECRCILNLLLNTYRLGKDMCTLCSSYVPDTIEHILFECSNGDNMRDDLWREVINACPRPLVDGMYQMSEFTRTKFLLNALRTKYVKEWHDIYVCVSKFIYKMYNQHYNSTKGTP